jgi:hypothetical protein
LTFIAAMLALSACIAVEAAPAGAGPPTITSVQFGGNQVAPTVFVRGSGFGSLASLGAPTPPGCGPQTGHDYGNNLILFDAPGGWAGGQGPGDCIGLIISAYSDSQIVYTVGSFYGAPNYVLAPGDGFQVTVLGATLSGIVEYPPAPGAINTLAGNGGFDSTGSGDGTGATSVALGEPSGVVVDAHGNEIIADTTEVIRIVAVSATNPGYVLESNCGGPCTWTPGDIFTIAGTAQSVGFNGDGIAATTATFNDPYQMAIDADGNLVVADADNGLVRVIAVGSNPGYTLGSDCGGGSNPCVWNDGDIFTLDSGAGRGVTLDSSGDVLFTSTNTVEVLAVSGSNPGYTLGGACSPTCTWTVGDTFTLAGDGTSSYNGDGLPATTAELDAPGGVAVDPSGNPIVTDTNNAFVRVVAVSSSNPGYLLGNNDCGGGSSPCTWTVGDIYNIAGTGTPGNNSDEDGHIATQANINQPLAVTVDAQGNPIIADTNNDLIEVIAVSASNPGYTLSGQCLGGGSPCTWSTGDIFALGGIVGGGPGYNGDNILATTALLGAPLGVALDSQGNVHIADDGNSRVREVALDPNAVLELAPATAPLGATVTAPADAAWTTQIYNPSPVAAHGVTVTLDANANGSTPLSFDKVAINLALGLPAAAPTCVPGTGAALVCSLADIPANSSELFTTFVKSTLLTAFTPITGDITASATNANSASGTLSTVIVVACASGCTTGVAAPGAPLSSSAPTTAQPTQQVLTLPANAANSSALPPVNVTLSSITPTAATLLSDHRLCPIAPNTTHCPGQISSVIGVFSKYVNAAKPIRVKIVARWGSAIPAGRILMEKSTGGDPLFLIACAQNPFTLQYNTPCVLGPETHTGTAGAGNLITTDTVLFTGLDVHFARRVSTGATKISPPAAPTALTATPGLLKATLHWKAPTVTNGAGVTSYVVSVLAGGVLKKTVTYATGALTQVVTGLVKGTSYTFKVAAKNVAGAGPASAASAVVTASAPLAPTGVTATAGPGEVTLHWTAPASNGTTAVTGYVVTVLAAGKVVKTVSYPSTALTETVTGLTRGTAYTFKVAAKNAAGTGSASAVSGPATPT